MTALDKALETLPAARIADELSRTLRESPSVVVSAPAGAGKSTLLPITILKSLPGKGKIIVLEPRRLAARQVASRMAELLGERPGQTVGYRIRFETRVGPATRIEVVTEGILTRMLADDPTLDGIDVVIFDEFHERSLSSDLGLALTRKAQELVRDDLKIVVMSATIDTDEIAGSLKAPVIRSEGRMFPVRIVHADVEATDRNAAEAVSHVLRQAFRENEGDILAFLPGEADIRRCEQMLTDVFEGTDICPLFAQLGPDRQRQAISPSPEGRRKIVLATPVAETSLTIEGVRTVVDSGLFRRMEFSQQNGLAHLVTDRISLDMAAQRAGRAGRLCEGVCYRLWSPATQARMKPFRTAEILEADLAPMLLELYCWGEGEAASLDWMTEPPKSGLLYARTLLESLGAVKEGSLTPLGKRMHELGCHPRIAGMMLAAQTGSQKALASDLAAIMEDRDPMSQQGGSSVLDRVTGLRRIRQRGSSQKGWDRILRASEQYCRMMHIQAEDSPCDEYLCGELLARAYPERIARASGAPGQFLLSGGSQVFLPLEDPLSSCEWIVAAGVSASTRGPGRVFLAAPVDVQTLDWAQTRKDNISWSAREGCLVARRETRIGTLVVSSTPVSDLAKEKAVEVICAAALKEGATMFSFGDDVRNIQRRISCLATWHPEEDIPDLSDEKLLERAPEWLPLYIGSARTVQELRRIDMCQVIWGLLSYGQQSLVDRLAPTHVQVPTGSRIRLEYRQGAQAPVLRVRLQECFGMTDSPRVDGGRTPVLMELLSPGFKPVQLTTDLGSFWKEAYFEVRKDLRRRYPKHSWPDDPMSADPTRGVRRRQD